MKLVFAGTPEFAAVALAALIAAGHEIVLAMTQPDRPAGRGLQVLPSAVKTLADRHGIETLQPAGLRLAGKHDADARLAQQRLGVTPHDAMVVAAYGLILPSTILAMAPKGCINIHASLLPRWRGAAPIQRAIEAGDAETGITIMQMDEGLDTGQVLLVRRLPIDPDDTGATLTAKLSALGGTAIVDALRLAVTDALVPRLQHPPGDASAVSYAAKLSKAEAPLDFGMTTRRLVDRIRAFDPWPGCSATCVTDVAGVADASSVYKIWRARAVDDDVASKSIRTQPGRVLGLRDGVDAAVIVATGDGAIALTALQKPGGRRQSATHFARDFADVSGMRFVADIR